MNAHFYIFYSFSDNHLYGVDGQDYGTTWELNEMGGNVSLFNLGGTTDFYNVRMALDLNENGPPFVRISLL